MGVFYTRKGDKGKSYVGKKSVNKTCVEVEALGQLDELNSMLGVLKSLPNGRVGYKITKELKDTLHQVQESLFIIQSHVANIMLKESFRVPKFKHLKVMEVEKIIDNIEKRLPPLKKFVIPGTNQASAWLDFIRAKSRNVERAVLYMLESKKINISDNSNISNIRSYLNRLSSLFFALARWETRNKKEKNPTYR
ncbi:MAG: ATP:cob(I)alamin adenosyltransferase [Candidatus Yanofskybacteria bacterium RIFCSPHIGHO2_02_FULL_41_29]|uniref:Corrinoid adenosyltransferase n=1 Tax=Candidatus Yanofskybacteria bacterium RIFCSPHIGHO2_01_FULL_41_53 TaxID=1802663 RepID=A0A1F8EJB8_9BACT|nr:MAG: ATP:cob(I)alamin adenosyltransferase [Candidatus Yanofskybacteria bacterium RIFCSPHIGHO2_01_FULL_41_53]OGN10537.1 MAG: ATP:cob(I)alamin adenosyltransferase [Candidatus Yanofskybacteria bacterium RIFCSPHIGHO2_02_FULL_41_29]OGN17939.1 MAG: ATP:cob(I)alamin adenosyltransferase [Candidatus Yanofskybacteria bacterium RIFCSPHIGHO2_12_FULL_41_9]OGN21684.1 MAG: ATP:cob(I)alamin adenosyltransferase [Candidatus Yanofskybacteria bacterium RIFCSPLOWO2_01_FULL_41_67]OGN29199.1 MAG: ATP:cob(I)alamin 